MQGLTIAAIFCKNFRYVLEKKFELLTAVSHKILVLLTCVIIVHYVSLKKILKFNIKLSCLDRKNASWKEY